MAWKPYQEIQLNLGHATASSITASINELLITVLIPDQFDVVQKNYWQLPIFDRFRDRLCIFSVFISQDIN